MSDPPQLIVEMADPDITGLLHAWRGGDEQALEQLTPHVYRELHRAAGQCMRAERPGHLLQTTALINELYLRLVKLKVWTGGIARTSLHSAPARCVAS